jgi:hypothetical protein
MHTFFARCAALALLLTGCSRNAAMPGADHAAVPRRDTLFVSVPVVRLTPADSTAGSLPIDSATLALLERRIMSRIASVLRAENQFVSGKKSAGIPPVKDAAPDIRHGLLGTITFADDGSIDDASRSRLQAVAKLLKEIDSPIELRVSSDLNSSTNMDVAMARVRRVYMDLIAENRSLGERDVAITVTGVSSTLPIKSAVEIYWREP